MSVPRKATKRKAKDEGLFESEQSCSKAPKRAKTNKKPDKKVNRLESEEGTTRLEPLWTTRELLSEQQDLNSDISETIINLLEEGNTVPFIARYRRDVTNNLSPERLREIKENYEEICTLKSKIMKTVKALEKSKVLTEPLENSIRSSRSAEELEYVYAPYKPGGKRTLAERAKEQGLEEPALQVLDNWNYDINLSEYIDKEKKELSNDEDVEKGIIHILAAVISTNTEVLTFLRELRKAVNVLIKTKKIAVKKKDDAKIVKDRGMKNNADESKFDNYDDFEIPLKYIKPHQVLAINRGESLKILSVKIVVPDKISHDFTHFCLKKWKGSQKNATIRQRIIEQAIRDSYTRLVQPLMIREIRSEMRQKAERASCDVFSTNLKHLLLAPPLKGKPILAVDPGFSNGCKLALVSQLGKLLAKDVIYPLKKSHNSNTTRDVTIVKNLLRDHNCDLIALGNGTGCRQTEEWLSRLISSGEFQPLNVQYTIVSEDGASIYSCSPEAKKEFPDLDPNIVSAVSLARRVQEPLAELVKVEPKHLGVGMYQHDLKKKQLDEALKDVVSECVSFVGVDLNTTSQCLLKHVAGLSDKRATQIVQFRNDNGPFICRKQLMEVSGIGSKIFQQCAGFLRVTPISFKDMSTFYKNKKTNKLDATYIHPESYNVADKLIKMFGLKSCNIGERDFINTVETELRGVRDLDKLSLDVGSTVETVKLILDTLSKPLSHDLRTESTSQTPLFRRGLTDVADISSGSVLTGRITNVTHFGCFVDIGVGRNGLIHVSKYGGFDLRLGDKVEVKVVSIDAGKNRISLQALKKL